MKKFILLTLLSPSLSSAMIDGLSLGISTSAYSFKTETGQFQEYSGESFDYHKEMSLPLGLEARYQVPIGSEWVLATRLMINLGQLDHYEKIDKDRDIQDNDGNNVRMVQVDRDYEREASTFLGAEVGRHYQIKRWTFTPFAGAGLSSEKEIFSRFMMTDRKKPVLFSKHNRYTHTVTHSFQTIQYLLGLEAKVQDVAFYIQHNIVKLNNSETQRDFQKRGEDFAFPDNIYGFATPTKDYAMTVIGARFYF